MLDIARNLSASASVHALTGSSRPGAVPPTSIATPLVRQNACPHAGDATCRHVDAVVIDLAERVQRLAARENRVVLRTCKIEDAVGATGSSTTPCGSQFRASRWPSLICSLMSTSDQPGSGWNASALHSRHHRTMRHDAS